MQLMVFMRRVPFPSTRIFFGIVRGARSLFHPIFLPAQLMTNRIEHRWRLDRAHNPEIPTRRDGDLTVDTI